MINNKLIRVIKPAELKKFEGTRIYLSTSSIVENKIIEDEGAVTYTDRPSRAALILLEYSVWFAKMRNSIKVFIAKKSDESKYIMSTGYYGFLPENTLLSKWLKFTFLSNEFNIQKDRYSEGSSMSGIKESQLNDIFINVIGDKQKLKIAIGSLDLVDSIIKNADEKLRNLSTLKEYLLNVMFV